MNRLYLILVALCVTVTIGCSTPDSSTMPTPTISEFFQTIGGGFISQGNTINYSIQFESRKPISASKIWFARIEFENPENPQNPFVQSTEFPSDQVRFSIHSEALYSIRNHKTYKVSLKAFSNPERTLLVTTHNMYVRFDIPDKLANSWGVKLL